MARTKQSSGSGKTITIIALVVAIAFLGVFLFHLINHNDPAETDADVDKNIQSVEESQSAEVEDVEKQYEKVEDTSTAAEDDSGEVSYKKKFSGCVIVGDSLTSDMQGGNNAGILCGWYNPGGEPVPEGLRVDYDIRDLNAVEIILDLEG